MPSLASLWLPIVLSAVFVFLVSSVVHMVLQIHKGDYKKMPNEDGVLDALRKLGVVPGQYMFPHCSSMQDFNKPEMKAKFEQGPMGTIVVRGKDCMNMGKALGQWFVFCLLISVFVAYLTSLGASHGVFRIATTVAVLGHCFTSVCDSIWKGVSWSTTVKFVFDGVLYALVTGATFAWLWPAAA
jgi:hypothetical protein